MQAGEDRRKKILSELTSSMRPINATKLAETYNVSRQIIVGDIALLRASGTDIYSTSRGYLLEKNRHKVGIIETIVSSHTPEETRKELEIIVNNGGEILDVSVEHVLYGTLTGNLEIKNHEDIQNFFDTMEREQAKSLSILTDGIHSHRIFAKTDEALAKILLELKKEDLLYHE
ncbi:hypothetical protein SAMN02745116_01630 [Pilibacter termitis]|uniref:Transcription repressor NadR n=1 Tax=Pilibacter termitis TaxID=263852 RepID=A0A1T4P326_9ENTE|nr:transcription repressor NadR [Pilibacter termitis]SJZ86010.1 hypothetical protein SAMN02745116_01630 [Pilibacter termitis]